MFAGHTGVRLDLTSMAKTSQVEDIIPALFNEELGAVLQIRADRIDEVHAAVKDADLADCTHFVGEVTDGDALEIPCPTEKNSLKSLVANCKKHGRKCRGKLPACVIILPARIRNTPAARWKMIRDFLYAQHLIPKKMLRLRSLPPGARPRIAILREQGVNSQTEMAACIYKSRF